MLLFIIDRVITRLNSLLLFIHVKRGMLGRAKLQGKEKMDVKLTAVFQWVWTYRSHYCFATIARITV